MNSPFRWSTARPEGGAAVPSETARLPRSVGALVLGLGLSTMAALVVTNGNLLAALAPTLLFCLLLVITRVPLRYPALVVVFLVLTVDNPAEGFASDHYRSPFYPVGVFLMAQLKLLIPVNALIFTGMDLFIVGTLLVHVYRRATRSPLDRKGVIGLPMPLLVACWVCLVGVMFCWAYGLASGGSSRFALWQVQRCLYLPVMVLLFQAIFPSPSEFRAYTNVLIAAALLRSVLAIVLRMQWPNTEYVTTHSDSMLFGTVTALLVIRIVHGVSARELRWSLLALAVLVGGMVQNERRLVWVELIFCALFLAFMTPRNRFKVRAAQIGLILAPVIAIYCAAGWHSTSTVFKPVATIRSVVDSKSDGSSLWRDLENFNLVATFGKRPVFGTGFGFPYELVRPMPSVTEAYELEPYAPHNSVLGLWTYCGYFGFSMLWMVLLVGMFFAARAYRFATEKFDRTQALTSFSCVLIYMLQCYGDMGLGSWVSVCLLGPVLSMVGKLAVKVGAWPRAAQARSLG